MEAPYRAACSQISSSCVVHSHQSFNGFDQPLCITDKTFVGGGRPRGRALRTFCRASRRRGRQRHSLRDGALKNQYPADGILETSKARGCDLIVMGSHGRRGLSRLVLGSQANRVIKHCICPNLPVSIVMCLRVTLRHCRHFPPLRRCVLVDIFLLRVMHSDKRLD
jgi:hypothetical protein